MDQINMDAIRQVQTVAKLLAMLPTIGAEAYANASATGRARPIVDNHFTRGSQGRYDFVALSMKYAMAKRGQLKSLRAGMKSMGRVVSQTHRQATGNVAAGDLPILVRTGRLRSFVNKRKKPITQQGDTATITFTGLPKYATYLHTGTAKMPARSPVTPDASGQDRAEVLAAMQKWLDAQIGGMGGKVALSD